MEEKQEDQFEALAKAVENKGTHIGIQGLAAAANIRSDALLHKQQGKMIDTVHSLSSELNNLDQTITKQQGNMIEVVESLKDELIKLDQTVSGLRSAIDKFNSDSTKMYTALNWLTGVIAVAAVVNALLIGWQILHQ